MRSGISTISLAVAGILTACAPAAPNTLTDADVNAVRANLDAWTQAALAADWDAWGMTLATDVVYMPPNMAPHIGREAVVTYGRGLPKLNSLAITASEITGLGDLAYARGNYAYSLTLSDGSAASDSGSILSIYRRQSDGTWLISRSLWHSDAAVPTPPTLPSRN